MAKSKIEDIDFKKGTYLFKFCSFNTNALQILINNTLYFSSPQELNDPLDSKFKVEVVNPENFKEETRQMIRESWFYNEEIKFKLKNSNMLIGDVDCQKSFLNFLLEYLQNTYSGVCCFSQIFENNLLWSHYADEGRGLCFVFNKEILLGSIAKNCNSKLYTLRKGAIEYGGVGIVDISLGKDGDIEFSTNHLFTKTEHWRHEEEFRIIAEINEDSRHLPFEPLNFNRFKFFQENALQYVVVGERIRKQHLEMIINICKGKEHKVEILQHSFEK